MTVHPQIQYLTNSGKELTLRQDRILSVMNGLGDVILVAGQSGSGKCTLGAQFICNEATQHGQAGVYASFVESASKLKHDMLRFNWV